MKILTSLSIFFLIILLIMPLFSQRETPPEGSQPKDFVLPAVKNFSLDNGFQASLVNYGELPKAVVRIMISAGNINESKENVWLADITMDLLKEGTSSLNAGEIARKAAGMGGTVNTAVGLDQSWIGGEVLSEFTPDLISLLAEILLSPGFPEKEFERLKKDYLRNLNIQKSRPQSLAQEKFLGVLYGDHPYGRIFPSESMISGYTLPQVKNFYEINFGALRAHIYVVGKFNAEKVEKSIRTSFASWKTGEETYVNIPQPQSKRKIYLVKRPDAPQSTIYLGLPVIDPTQEDYFPM